jgi:ubiquinone/menaquinone biosynthesis C-methylase UbiE
MLLIFLFIIIFINRILLNENYQEHINVGYFYSLFCKDFEQKLFMKSMKSMKYKIPIESKILDFGCGPGIMSDFFGTNYIGIDIDKTRINYAKQKYPNKKFILTNPNNYLLPFSDDYFDIILFNDTLHHLSNYTISKLLPEISRILKKDGLIIVREPKKDTNIFTYFITELFENGDYVRTSYEYKQIFESFDIISEISHNEIIREYYILQVKNNKNCNFYKNFTTEIKIDRYFMNIITCIIFIISLIHIYYKFNSAKSIFTILAV